MIIIDIIHCEIIHEMYQDPDTIPDNTSDMLLPHLTRKIWVVILAAERSEAKRHELTKTHF